MDSTGLHAPKKPPLFRFPPHTGCEAVYPEQMLNRPAAQCVAHGGHLTRLRKEVLQQLHQSPEGLKAYAILKRIQGGFPSVSATTVYRALEFLVEQGLAHRLPGHNLFTACRLVHNPVRPCLFLVCRSCRIVIEMEDDGVARTLEHCLGRTGYRLEDPSVELSALCPTCQTRSSETPPSFMDTP
jgi:Fur family transcriptional regulator, zinc uptake regulator